MKRRSFKRPVRPIHRPCTKMKGPDAHRLINACYLIDWRRWLGDYKFRAWLEGEDL